MLMLFLLSSLVTYKMRYLHNKLKGQDVNLVGKCKQEIGSLLVKTTKGTTQGLLVSTKRTTGLTH